MALIIKNSKVVYISPPKKLSIKEKEILKKAPIHKKIIQRAISRKYRVV